jgi:hypothetical protein
MTPLALDDQHFEHKDLPNSNKKMLKKIAVGSSK